MGRWIHGARPPDPPHPPRGPCARSVYGGGSVWTSALPARGLVGLPPSTLHNSSWGHAPSPSPPPPPTPLSRDLHRRLTATHKPRGNSCLTYCAAGGDKAPPLHVHGRGWAAPPEYKQPRRPPPGLGAGGPPPVGCKDKGKRQPAPVQPRPSTSRLHSRSRGIAGGSSAPADPGLRERGGRGAREGGRSGVYICGRGARVFVQEPGRLEGPCAHNLVSSRAESMREANRPDKRHRPQKKEESLPTARTSNGSGQSKARCAWQPPHAPLHPPSGIRYSRPVPPSAPPPPPTPPPHGAPAPHPPRRPLHISECT